MLTTIYLHGALGRKFGKEWKLDIGTVNEAIRAININLKDALFQYWRGKGRDKKYRIKIGDYAINDEREILSPTGNVDNIHIVPVTKGSKDSLGKIIGGVVLIVVGAILVYTGYGAAAGKSLISAGIGMLAGGVIQMLTPIPNFAQNAGTDDGRGSTLFAGVSSQQSQGGPVGLVYGKMMVSPMPVAVSLSNEDTKITTGITITDVDFEELEGGGVQYRYSSRQ